MPPFYELLPTTSGKWLLCRIQDGSPVVAEFHVKEDAYRALLLFERSEHITKSLVDVEQAKQEFDRAFVLTRPKKSTNPRPSTVSGYDHQLDD